jgi:hypothetical protein
MSDTPKTCERCGRGAAPGLRFCHLCKNLVLHALRLSGTLTPLPPPERGGRKNSVNDWVADAYWRSDYDTLEEYENRYGAA